MAKLVDVQPEHLDLVKPIAGPWIEKAAASKISYFTADEVWQSLHERQAQLWFGFVDDVPESVCVTQLEETAKGRLMKIWLVCGHSHRNWQDLIGQLEQWAKREGCIAVRFDARRGWARALAKRGYTSPQIILEKRL